MWSIWLLFDADILDSSIGIVGTCLDWSNNLEAVGKETRIQILSHPHIESLCSFFWWGFPLFPFKNCQCELRFFKEQVEHGEIIQAGFLKGAHMSDPLEVLMVASLLDPSQYAISLYQLWNLRMMYLMRSSSKKLPQTQQTHQPKRKQKNTSSGCVFFFCETSPLGATTVTPIIYTSSTGKAWVIWVVVFWRWFCASGGL